MMLLLRIMENTFEKTLKQSQKLAFSGAVLAEHAQALGSIPRTCKRKHESRYIHMYIHSLVKAGNPIHF